MAGVEGGKHVDGLEGVGVGKEREGEKEREEEEGR